MGKKGQQVFTGGGDEAALARGIFETYTDGEPALLAAGAARHVQGGQHRHQPAGADRDLRRPTATTYKFLFIAKGGGSANKSYLFQETKALLNPASLADVRRRRSCARSAPPPARRTTSRSSSAARRPSARSRPSKLASAALPRRPADAEGNELGRALPRSGARSRGAGARADAPASARSSAASTSATTCASSACRATAPRARSASPSRAPPTARRSARSRATASSSSSSRRDPAQYLPEITDAELDGEVVHDRPQPPDGRRSAPSCRSYPDQDAALAHRDR